MLVMRMSVNPSLLKSAALAPVPQYASLNPARSVTSSNFPPPRLWNRYTLFFRGFTGTLPTMLRSWSMVDPFTTRRSMRPSLS